MRPNDWFKLASPSAGRCGSWSTLLGTALSIFNMAVGFATVPERYSLLSYLVQAIGSFLVGIVLLLGAPVIADIFYPDSPSDETAKKNSSDSNAPTI